MSDNGGEARSWFDRLALSGQTPQPSMFGGYVSPAANPRVVNPTPAAGSSGPGGEVKVPSPGNGYNGQYQGTYYQNGYPVGTANNVTPRPGSPTGQSVNPTPQQPYSWNPSQWGGFGGGMQNPFMGMGGMGMFNPLSMFGGMGGMDGMGGYGQMPNVGGFFGGSGLMSMLMNLMSSMPMSMMIPPSTISGGGYYPNQHSNSVYPEGNRVGPTAPFPATVQNPRVENQGAGARSPWLTASGR